MRRPTASVTVASTTVASTTVAAAGPPNPATSITVMDVAGSTTPSPSPRRDGRWGNQTPVLGVSYLLPSGRFVRAPMAGRLDARSREQFEAFPVERTKRVEVPMI